MKHVHLSLCCNELPFLKRKLPLMYKHFDQIIIVDYDILNKCGSRDGSIEFMTNFPDPENKLKVITDFDPSIITEFEGVSVIEKRKMFAHASAFIWDEIDVVWATDLDEFFEPELLKIVEEKYKDPSIVSIDLPHRVFIKDTRHIFNFGDNFYICPRITRHTRKIYGHCNFRDYGKTVTLPHYLYHFSYVGLNRIVHKLNVIAGHTPAIIRRFVDEYLKEGVIHHPNPNLNAISIPFIGHLPTIADFDIMCQELE